MAIDPNIQNTTQPNRRTPRFLRNAGRIAATALTVVAVAPFVKGLQETAVFELKDKPALKDKAAAVKEHQKNMLGIVKDAQEPGGSIIAAPYNKVQVRNLRKAVRKDGTSEKIVPPMTTHEESKNGGSFTAQNFSSLPSREATVAALDDTIRATQKIKLDGHGLDKIYSRYRDELADEQAKAARHEESAIAMGLAAAEEQLAKTYENKPVLNHVGYPEDPAESTGFLIADNGELYTAEYPEDGVNSVPTVLPNTVDQAIREVTHSTQAGQFPQLNSHR